MSHAEESQLRNVVEIMSELRRGTSTRIAILTSAFEELREVLQSLYSESAFDGILAPLNQAHAILEQTQAEGDATGGLPFEAFASLEILAKPPGHSYSGWHPKGWVARLYRLFFGRQYAFNELLLSSLASTAQRTDVFCHLVLRLLGACNAQVTHLIRYERQVAETLISVSEKLEFIVGGMLLQSSEERRSDVDSQESQRSEQPVALKTEVDSLKAFLTALERRLETLEARASHWQTIIDNWHEYSLHHEQLRRHVEQTLNEVCDELTALKQLACDTAVQRKVDLGRARAEANEGLASAPAPLSPTFSFLEFERALRGSEIQITQEQARYLPWFADAAAPVLDLGCGRGEFLELLREHGIPASGVDRDPDMVRHCRAKGLAVEEGTLIDYLSHVPDESLGGIFMGQVVEHLDQATVLELPPLLWRKLVPGGAVVIETVNPMCLSTFAGAMYADPTHVRPLHPKGLEFLMTSAGFVEATLILSAPVPEGDKLALVKEKGPLDPVTKDLVLQINDNFARLNTLLYSYANYALAVRKPKRA
ncbi:MAG: class I SAM-dependent methyltransferase [Candidatus Sumerlaeaceae bacterium]